MSKHPIFSNEKLKAQKKLSSSVPFHWQKKENKNSHMYLKFCSLSPNKTFFFLLYK